MSQEIYCEPCGRVIKAELDEERTAPCPECGTLIQPPDVFISYSTPDFSRAQDLAALFRREKLTPWFAPEDRVSLGHFFATAIVNALDEARVVVLLLSRYAIESAWVRSEVVQAVNRNLPILPLVIQQAPMDREFELLLGPHQWASCSGDSFADQADKIVRRVRLEVRANRLTKAKTIAVGPEITEEVQLRGISESLSPYIGPTPIPRTWGKGFYGRESEAEQVLNLIRDSRVVLLYAPSGAGKSSLLNAEIAPSLEAANYDVQPGSGSGGIRVGGVVDDELKFGKDLRNIFAYSAISGLEGGRPSLSRRLVDCLRDINRGTKRNRIVIFDQFEELFTQHSERHEDRGGFMDQVVEALRADAALHVLFAIRKEFLSDMLDLAKRNLPQEFAMRQFALPRMGAEGALEAITRPVAKYARYASGVAEEIVKQLGTIRVPGADNKLKSLPGEYIEMVHLQIVCKRLWEYLAKHSPGITQIERHHLENFCGEGQTLEDFVPNALNAFYEETIKRVSADESERKAIQFGLMKFITMASTRTIVQRTHDKTGRLSNLIVDALEREHLLRFEKRGEQLWYELSHDSLAGPVAKQRDVDPELSKLLFASDLLDKMLEKAKAESSESLNDYFGEHHEILAECKRFQSPSHSLLEQQELEFLFRASLRSGQEQCEWSQQLKEHFPDSHMRALKNALSYYSCQAPEVARKIREHAVVLLGQIGENAEKELLDILVKLSLQDEAASVRQAAALSLARLDRPDLYDEVISALSQPDSTSGAIAALARVRIAVDSNKKPKRFETTFWNIPPRFQKSIRSLARRTRFKERFPAFPFVFIPAASFAAIMAGPFKMGFGSADWALTQHQANAGMGLFHGSVAGVIWAGLIALGITYYHVVHGREQEPKSVMRPLGSLVLGGLSGLLGSLVIVIVIIWIYGGPNLVEMGWLDPKTISDLGDIKFRWSGPFLSDIFLRTRFGLVHLITGVGLGFGMAMMTNAIRASTRWTEFLDRQNTINSLGKAKQVTWEIMTIAFPKIWWLLFPVVLAAFLACWVPDTAAFESIKGMRKANFVSLAKGLTGDCLTQAFGAYFGIVGMFLGIVALRYGVMVEPREDQA